MTTSRLDKKASPYERELTGLLIFGIPFGVVVGLFMDIGGAESTGLAVRWYAALLGTYMGWILAQEYLAYPELHRLKSGPADSLLVAGTFLGVRQLSQTAGSVKQSLFWLTMVLLGLVAWETYTMLCGYADYFGMRVRVVRITLLNLARTPEAEAAKDKALRWREYRFWVFLDATGCLVVGLAWAGSNHLLATFPHGAVEATMVTVGVLIGLLNSCRYAVLVRNVRRLRQESETIPPS